MSRIGMIFEKIRRCDQNPINIRQMPRNGRSGLTHANPDRQIDTVLHDVPKRIGHNKFDGQIRMLI
ncbi:hypothetical protein AA0488_0446 [Kozakia baliensis NRIC 0488]|nr:hypothetical protein AA0488_0446 [Kozakia baliensis NRIC 0488]